MKKKPNYALIILFFLSCFYITSAFTNKGDAFVVEDPMVYIFEESEATILESNINTTLTLNNTLWSQEEIQEIKEELKSQLGLQHTTEVIINEENYKYYSETEATLEDKSTLFLYEFSDDGVNQFLATNTSENGEIITFKVYSSSSQGEKTSYIIIDIMQNKGYKQLVEKSNQSQEILKKYGDHIETTINMVGTYDEKMSIEQRQEKIQEIIQPLKPQKVEEIKQESYVSTTIYTPIIPHSLQYGDKKVNLQLAMRYNDYEEKTYLYIATPLITMTY
ncbi:MAG: YwmB family TATA-box binding protein [Clostridiaceae bacterium]|nr:YwmB family TATA-box binding protein [Clostridiaceae bacterium]